MKSDQLHITQHKRFVPLAHPNFCPTKTPLMLGPIYEMAGEVVNNESESKR